MNFVTESMCVTVRVTLECEARSHVILAVAAAVQADRGTDSYECTMKIQSLTT
jgi:hypothetical protein